MDLTPKGGGVSFGENVDLCIIGLYPMEPLTPHPHPHPGYVTGLTKDSKTFEGFWLSFSDD